MSHSVLANYCPAHSLDSLGHHALTCKHGGDVVTRHNRLPLRDPFVKSCRRVCVGVQVEVGVVTDFMSIANDQLMFLLQI